MPSPASIESLIERIDALLPQTQCARCGFPTCRAYAEAIATNRVPINQCPPGGADGVVALSQLLDREPMPLNPVNGLEEVPQVAFIDEDVCIGCTKCIEACPVDAIVGAVKHMHTIIAAECTGCGLCLPPCPVDCIALLPVAEAPLERAQVLMRARHARSRFDVRSERVARTRANVQRRHAGAASVAMPLKPSPSRGALGGDGVGTVTEPTATKPNAAAPISRNAVLEAIARGKARRHSHIKDVPSQ